MTNKELDSSIQPVEIKCIRRNKAVTREGRIRNKGVKDKYY